MGITNSLHIIYCIEKFIFRNPDIMPTKQCNTDVHFRNRLNSNF